MYPDGIDHERLRPRADPHRGGVGQARVRLPVAQGADVPRVDRAARRRATTATASTTSRAIHRELDQEYPINWKAFVENSNDDYHVRFVHRRLNEQRRSLDTIVRFEGRTCSGYKPHADVVDPPGGRDRPRPRKHCRGHYADFIYPNLTPLPYATVLILVRADPIAPDRTRLFSRIYGLGNTLEEEAGRPAATSS